MRQKNDTVQRRNLWPSPTAREQYWRDTERERQWRRDEEMRETQITRKHEEAALVMQRASQHAQLMTNLEAALSASEAILQHWRR